MIHHAFVFPAVSSVCVSFLSRMQLKKMKHLIFYSLPTYPHFFSDICNMYRSSHRSECLVLFSRLEASKLAGSVGSDRARHMISGEKSVYMFVTGEEDKL